MSILDRLLPLEDKKELVEELFDFYILPVTLDDGTIHHDIYNGTEFFYQDLENKKFQLETLRGIIEYAKYKAVQEYKWELWRKFNKLL